MTQQEAEEKLTKSQYIGQTYKVVLARTTSYETAVRIYQKYEGETSERLTIFEGVSNGIFSVTLGEYGNSSEAETKLRRITKFCEGARVMAVSDL